MTATTAQLDLIFESAWTGDRFIDTVPDAPGEYVTWKLWIMANLGREQCCLCGSSTYFFFGGGDNAIDFDDDALPTCLDCFDEGLMGLMTGPATQEGQEAPY